jgi:hypothetical protein
MFEDLAEQIRQDERSQSSRWERVALGLVVLVVSIVLFAGLYLGVRLLD